jgi:acetate kinase
MGRLSDQPVLVVNAGSTSLKLDVVDAQERAQRVSLDDVPPVAAVGHRVVHGGALFADPVVVDDSVEADLAQLVDLAPLQNGSALEAIRSLRARIAVPHVAVFDTAFHRTIPDVAATYALPRRYRDRGLRRFGFHGSSVQWASEQVPVARLVVCHLGGGASVTAVRDGRSVDTTMGFTPLEGVPMATRSGSVDPGALLHLLGHGVTADELGDALERESGLLGLSEESGRVEELDASDDPRARLALDVYGYRIATAVAGMCVALGGLDALVFTAGVGENSATVRRAVCERLAFLGVKLDEEANRAAVADAEIGAANACVRVVVVRSREEVVIARAVRDVVATA